MAGLIFRYSLSLAIIWFAFGLSTILGWLSIIAVAAWLARVALKGG